MIEQIIKYQDQITKALFETLFLVGVSSLIALGLGLLLGIAIYISKDDGLRPSKVMNSLSNAYVNIVRSFLFIGTTNSISELAPSGADSDR